MSAYMTIAGIACVIATVATIAGVMGVEPGWVLVTITGASIVMFVAMLVEVRAEFGYRDETGDWKRR